MDPQLVMKMVCNFFLSALLSFDLAIEMIGLAVTSYAFQDKECQGPIVEEWSQPKTCQDYSGSDYYDFQTLICVGFKRERTLVSRFMDLFR
jgi:hypothetical protein